MPRECMQGGVLEIHRVSRVAVEAPAEWYRVAPPPWLSVGASGSARWEPLAGLLPRSLSPGLDLMDRGKSSLDSGGVNMSIRNARNLLPSIVRTSYKL